MCCQFCFRNLTASENLDILTSICKKNYLSCVVQCTIVKGSSNTAYSWLWPGTPSHAHTILDLLQVIACSYLEVHKGPCIHVGYVFSDTCTNETILGLLSEEIM